MKQKNTQMSISCRKLIKTHRDTIKWLLNNNPDGIHNNSIKFRQNEIKRLNSNPF